MSTLVFAAGEPSANRALAAARLRGRVLRNLRRVLVVLIGLLALNIVIQSVLSGGRQAAIQPAVAGDAERIINPRFTGRDADGRAYVLTADNAVRRAGGLGNLTDLENPRIDYALLFGAANRPDASEVLSRVGVYDDQTRILRMTDTVRFITRSGYRFQTEGAAIDLDNAIVFGDEPVEGFAPWGGVQANGFELDEDGRRLRFTAGVVTRFYTGEAPAPEEVE
ncbi:MAG: lipopolysaccharide export system permease component LptG [Oceanicaulis sp. HLUCCA04]|nr:MAG: lipopolysaccharide export system permease component LptG [Oceanicaulis sp. HLUCCA04]